MALILSGRNKEAWYLRKQIGGKRKDYALGVYGGEANRKKAEKAAKAMEATLTQAHAATAVLQGMGLGPAPAPTEEAGMTLNGWWDRYKETSLLEKAPETQKDDIGRMNHWLPILGHMRMVDIKPAHCIEGMNLRRKQKQANPGRKNPTVVMESTVQRERVLLQAIFERALENDIITKNPWTGLDKPKDKPRDYRILTEENEVRLKMALRTPAGNEGNRARAKPEVYIRFIDFMLETGLRIDELLNKHFRDRKDRVHVLGKGTKERDVYLTTFARQTLDAQVKAEGKRWHQHPSRFWDVLAKGCERAGIDHISPHDLRHSFGHRFLVKGGDIFILSKVLGHASVKVTQKHYAYLSSGDVGAKMLAVMEPAAATPQRTSAS